MSWLNFFEPRVELKHSFGRGLNANLGKDEEELFNKSYEAFEKKDNLNGYEYFINSLQNYSNHTSNSNIVLIRQIDKINFELFQGCAKIVGTITDETLEAEVIIVKKEIADVALKRYLLERNYQFTYCNYFSDDEHIKLRLLLDNIALNPHKIFFPLREIALNADFDKEFAKSEFESVVLEDVEHLEAVDIDELKIKYEYLKKWISDIKEKIAALPSSDNAGMQSFILLYLLLKVDYLIAPKYALYQKITKKIIEYFLDDGVLVEAKNEELLEFVDELESMGFDEFCKNFYKAKYTFNPNERATHEEIVIFIDESYVKLKWYKNNRFNQILPIMYKYIAFYLLYNYGLHPVTRGLLHILVEVQNPEFFSSLGYTHLYDAQNNSFAKRTIISRIEDVISYHKSRFKLLKPFGEELNFTSLNEFSNSFYIEIKNLNFQEI